MIGPQAAASQHRPSRNRNSAALLPCASHRDALLFAQELWRGSAFTVSINHHFFVNRRCRWVYYAWALPTMLHKHRPYLPSPLLTRCPLPLPPNSNIRHRQRTTFQRDQNHENTQHVLNPAPAIPPFLPRRQNHTSTKPHTRQTPHLQTLQQLALNTGQIPRQAG
jgi:hypothetical protein